MSESFVQAECSIGELLAVKGLLELSQLFKERLEDREIRWLPKDRDVHGITGYLSVMVTVQPVEDLVDRLHPGFHDYLFTCLTCLGSHLGHTEVLLSLLVLLHIFLLKDQFVPFVELVGR